jgi:hypothetical protein
MGMLGLREGLDRDHVKEAGIIQQKKRTGKAGALGNFLTTSLELQLHSKLQLAGRA